LACVINAGIVNKQVCEPGGCQIDHKRDFTLISQQDRLALRPAGIAYNQDNESGFLVIIFQVFSYTHIKESTGG
jgi:hypothetical protein